MSAGVTPNPTLTDGVTTVTLDRPTFGGVARSLVWNKIKSQTLGGTGLEQTQSFKYAYELQFKMSTKYKDICDFLIAAASNSRQIYFAYEKWSTSSPNIEVTVDISDEKTKAGELSDYSMTFTEVNPRS